MALPPERVQKRAQGEDAAGKQWRGRHFKERERRGRETEEVSADPRLPVPAPVAQPPIRPAAASEARNNSAKGALQRNRQSSSANKKKRTSWPLAKRVLGDRLQRARCLNYPGLA